MEISINTTGIASRHVRWPLPRVLMFMLAGAFFGLMTDIRVEHVDVVHEQSIAWLPIIYGAFMGIACLGACVFWNALTRRIMAVLFLLALVVGGTGFYLHNRGRLTHVITRAVNAWIDPNLSHSDAPPQLAPLAFTGLGTIGILVSLKRFNS